MQISDSLAQMGGLQSMARELVISEAQAASGAEARQGHALTPRSTGTRSFIVNGATT